MSAYFYILIFGVLGQFSLVGKPMVVAHRGASGEAPENTIPAFKLAWRQGADAIEGDFHLTKDGQVVCIHDANTKKVAEKNLVVKNTTLAELKKLDVGIKKGLNLRILQSQQLERSSKRFQRKKRSILRLNVDLKLSRRF